MERIISDDLLKENAGNEICIDLGGREHNMQIHWSHICPASSTEPREVDEIIVQHLR